jgi:hypothetical protein
VPQAAGVPLWPVGIAAVCSVKGCVWG